MTHTRATIPQFANVSSRARSWPRSVALELALENRAIGRRIAELRENAHLTQPVAADKAGVSLRGYQKWEGGESRPSWANLERLAEVFHTKPEDIIGDSSPQEEISAERLDRIEEKLDELLRRTRREPPAEGPDTAKPDDPLADPPPFEESPPSEEDQSEPETG